MSSIIDPLSTNGYKVLELSKSAQSKQGPKADLERHVVLDRTPHVDVREVVLHAFVGDHVNAVALCSLHADNKEANEQGQGLGEDRD